MSLRPYDKEWLSQLCAESDTLVEVLRKAGRKQGGGTQATLKKKIAEYGIDISHFKGQGWSKGKTLATDERIHSSERYNIEDIFVENSPYTRAVARGYILRHSLIPYKCARCGNEGEWQEEPLSLQLDHKNGINNDHRLENLQWLCPNCHALTSTFAGRNKSSSKGAITIEEVAAAIQEYGTVNAKELCQAMGRAVNGSSLNKIKLLISELEAE